MATVTAERLGAGSGLPGGISVSQVDGARYPSNAVPESTITRVGTETGEVAMVNVAPKPPAGMKTFAGGVSRLVLPLTSVTSMPPGGAGFNSVTVPVSASPPITLSSLSSRPNSSGNNPSELCCQLPPIAARIVPTVAPETGTDVIGETVASVAPAGIVTLNGVCACEKSLATLTTTPPAGAGVFSVTRACVELPPETLLGAATMERIDTPDGGPAAILKLAPADHGPRTAPCTARTRQK